MKRIEDISGAVCGQRVKYIKVTNKGDEGVEIGFEDGDTIDIAFSGYEDEVRFNGEEVDSSN